MLCASSADHSVICLVEPPAGTAAGARVSFPGFEGEPATAAQVAKKKILEGLLPDVSLFEKLFAGVYFRSPCYISPPPYSNTFVSRLQLKTDSSGVATWQAVPFTIGRATTSFFPLSLVAH